MTDSPPTPSTAAAFRQLWESLPDLIGSSATATLVRRAAKHGTSKSPALAGLLITKPAFEYELVVPVHWSDDGTEDLRVLLQMLYPLLVELTGMIVVQRLRSIPALQHLLGEDDREP